MLQIFVKNNIRIKGANTRLKSAVTKELTYDNPAFKKLKRMGRRAWGVPAKLELFIYDRGDLVIPRGFLDRLKELLQTIEIDPNSVLKTQQTEGSKVNFGQWNPEFKLRKYQKPFIESLLKNDGVGVAPAGSGKTIMGLRYIYEKEVPAVWLTHTKDLMYQTAKRAEALFKDVGKIGLFGDGKHEWGDGKLIIGMVQTLQANPHYIDAMNDFIGTVVIDEAHHFPAVQFVETAGRFKAKNLVGVTATPNRKDGLDMYMLNGIGPIRYQVKRDNLYEAGELIKPKVEFIYTGFNYEYASDRNDINSVDAGGDDLDYTDLIQKLIADEKRSNLIAETIVKNADKGPAIVITESVRYCFELERKVKKRLPNLRTAVVHGGITRYKWLTKRPPEGEILEVKSSGRRKRYKVQNYTEDEFIKWQVTKKQRQEVMEKASRKEIDVLFATQLAREGLDLPHLTVGHMAMPKRGDTSGSKNGAAVEQEIGRIMRSDPNNKNKKAIWFDYVDYDVGVFKDQYYSRRRVYKRLGIPLPNKPRTYRDEVADFLSNVKLFEV